MVVFREGFLKRKKGGGHKASGCKAAWDAAGAGAAQGGLRRGVDGSSASGGLGAGVVSSEQEGQTASRIRGEEVI